jgi:hypothetical protein
MKSVDDLALTVLSSLSQSVCVQVGDPVDHLKACSRFEGMERLKSVDQLLEDVTPDPAQSQTPNWIISETTSPADYQPQIAALTMARGPPRQLVGGPITEAKRFGEQLGCLVRRQRLRQFRAVQQHRRREFVVGLSRMSR